MIAIDDIRSFESDMITNRRYFHQFPETGFEEWNTSKTIIDRLAALGIDTIENVGKTGVIGVLKGRQPGKTVALRADMDALNLTESNDIEFKSQNEGKMHACGHDAHMAMLLGTAAVLAQQRSRLKGTVKFVFQPAEEGPYPGGGKLMVDSGHLDDASAIFALHVDTAFDTGTICIPRGTAMAAADFFKIGISGKGCHGAAPHLGIDPILMAAEAVNAFQSIISRRINPANPGVLSVCTINGGSTHNIIPESVVMTGTIRALDEETRILIFDGMDDVLRGITSVRQARYTLERTEGYPPLVNHPEMVAIADHVCRRVLGETNVVINDIPNMAAEDFSYYVRKIPGAMLWLGCGNADKGCTAGLHNPGFMLDEAALLNGTSVLANLVGHFLFL